MCDALALFDHQEIDEARERMAEEDEIFLPIPGRECQDLHLLDRQRQRGTITPARREP
jgi:hypothetical protein